MYVKSSFNPGDIGSRPEKVKDEDVGSESHWERGLPWIVPSTPTSNEDENEYENEYEKGVAFGATVGALVGAVVGAVVAALDTFVSCRRARRAEG